MPIIKIQTNFNIDLEFEAAEFPRRLGAWFIDLCTQLFYLFTAIKVYSILQDGKSMSVEDAYNSWAIGLLIILPLFLYHGVSEITLNGQSVGKKLLKIRVVNENGGKASVGQYMIRWLIRIIPFAFIAGRQDLVGNIAAAIFVIMDIVLIVSTPKAQRLGDLLAGTILIRTNPKGNIDDTVFLEIADNYVPSFPQIMQLSDKDINSIKSILDTSKKKGDFQLATMASEKIKSHLKIDSSLSPYDFLEVLMKDYNYLSVK